MTFIRLTIVRGYTIGQQFETGKATDQCFVVGRRQGSNMVVADKRMSREHFEIQRLDGQWKLKDLGSSNGTWVNEIRIDEVNLQNGDIVEAGDTRFMVSIYNQPSSPRDLSQPGSRKNRRVIRRLFR